MLYVDSPFSKRAKFILQQEKLSHVPKHTVRHGEGAQAFQGAEENNALALKPERNNRAQLIKCHIPLQLSHKFSLFCSQPSRGNKNLNHAMIMSITS